MAALRHHEVAIWLVVIVKEFTNRAFVLNCVLQEWWAE